MIVDDPNTPWNFWSAFGAIASAAAAFMTAGVAWYQISALRTQQQGWETLKACERYDSDAVLNEALKKLRDARDSGELEKNPRPFRLEITTIMNYLEGVATGIEQGFYDARIVRDHLEPIMRFHAGEVLNPIMLRRLEVHADDFDRVKRLPDSWDAARRPWFKR
jgi:hypothetical protein